MNRFFVPTLGPTDWRRLLADPERHWVRKRSAFELAVAWEAACDSGRGFPPDVEGLLDGHDLTRGATLLIGIPEHQVPLPGGGHASQTDLWALLGRDGQFLSLAVEAKAGEKLGETVAEWMRDVSPNSGKPARLSFVRERLGLSNVGVDDIRYQLLHRAASALLEAERFSAATAVLLVQAFGQGADRPSFIDFQRIGALLGPRIEEGRLTEVPVPGQVRLLLGWLECRLATDQEVATSV